MKEILKLLFLSCLLFFCHLKEKHIMRLVILETYEQVSEWAAKYVRNKILKYNPGPGKCFVLGLPTGTEMKTCHYISYLLLSCWFA